MHFLRGGPLRGHGVHGGNRIVVFDAGLSASGDELQLSPLLRQMTWLRRLQRFDSEEFTIFEVGCVEDLKDEVKLRDAKISIALVYFGNTVLALLKFVFSVHE